MPPIDNPEIALAIGYAAAPARPGLTALFALDARLATILRRTREPLVGQMRLTWWHEALTKLDMGSTPPAEPVLTALAGAVVPTGIAGTELARIVEGWEALLDEPLDAAALERHGVRGRALFGVAGRLLGAEGDPVAAAGAGWALADLSRHLSDPEPAATAAALARPMLAEATGQRWSRNGRALGALAHLARMDLRTSGQPRIGAPGRVLRMVRHRLTGR